ncbi:unnamed protein product [Musa textilis]
MIKPLFLLCKQVPTSEISKAPASPDASMPWPQLPSANQATQTTVDDKSTTQEEKASSNTPSTQPKLATSTGAQQSTPDKAQQDPQRVTTEAFRQADSSQTVSSTPLKGDQASTRTPQQEQHDSSTSQQVPKNTQSAQQEETKDQPISQLESNTPTVSGSSDATKPQTDSTSGSEKKSSSTQ